MISWLDHYPPCHTHWSLHIYHGYYFLHYWLHVYFYIHLMLLYVARTFVSLNFFFLHRCLNWLTYRWNWKQYKFFYIPFGLKKNDLATHEISKCLTTLPSLYIYTACFVQWYEQQYLLALITYSDILSHFS